MTLEFGFTTPVWLLGLLPIVWLVGRLGRRARPRFLHVVARSLVLACLIGALAQPVVSLPASHIAVIYVVDVSHSVSARGLDDAAGAIDALNRSVGPDESRILAFGGSVATLPDTAALRRLAAPIATGDVERFVSAEDTNLEQALAAARAEIPASTSGRIVLFSDGRETDGHAQRIAERLAAEHVAVFTVPLPVRDLGDTWIESVRVPHGAVAEALTTVEVVVGSQVARTAEVTVREGSRELARQRIALSAGRSAIPIDVSFDTPGPHLVEAGVVADGEVVAENKTLQHEVLVEPRPRVLYVHGEAADPGTTPLALTQAGIEITTARPQELPKAPEALDRWDVVVLSNVARKLLSSGAMKALGSWVEDRGGGLLLIGGDAVFGEGLDQTQAGYRYTELERVLPVTFDRDDEPDVALVIVIDRSWSMYGPAMELTKAAAEAAANTLSSPQLLGVLTFNDQSNWDIPLARMRDIRPTLHEAIGRIAASGPTAIYPALERAYTALSAVRARAKHVILLSDGQTEAQDFEGLIKEMSSAKITVSSVALGPDADVTLLRHLATWGGGQNYVVQDAQQIPEIFVKEAKSAATPGPDQGGGIAPIVRQAADFLEATADIPALQDRNVVTRKPQALELLATSGSDPLLTIWPASLGRTAMFAADVDGRWTREWMRWHGLGAFLGSVVRSLAPRRPPLSALTVTAGDRQGTERALDVSLDVHDRDGRPGNLTAPAVEVRKGAVDRAMLPLLPGAPGRYEARIVADTTEPLAFSIVDAKNGVAASRIFVADRAAEYRFAVPDEPLLSALARATGGVMNPTADDLRRAPRNSELARHPLAPWLLAVGLVLWPAEICLRRFWR